jgi:hypothetical protein
MTNHMLLVVGDKFSSYVQGRHAITLSQLRALLSLPAQLLPVQGRTLLIPGQGMGDADIQDLLREAASSMSMAYFDFSLWHDLPVRAPLSMSHKHHAENTLISVPRETAEDCFELDLLIDEQCELMRDHQTGQHIQGMLLIEAARQAMLAVVENFYLPSNGLNYVFVLNDMSVSYNNFAFPVAATIECRVLSKQVDNPRKLAFVTDAVVRQCNTEVSSLTFTFSALDRERVDRSESLQANRIQQRFLDRFEAELYELEEPLKPAQNQ